MRTSPTAALALGALFVLAACDLPTEGPELEQRWVVPVERTSVSVGEFLPDGMTVSGDAFLVAVDPIETGRSLGSLCPECALADGLTLPVPAFSGSFATGTDLPPEVVEATLASGTIELEVRNEFTFDPLAGGGRLAVVLGDGTGGRTLARLELDGAKGDALAPGATLRRTLALAPGTTHGTISAVASLTVPGGAVARVEAGRQVRVRAIPSALRLTSARVDVGGETVEIEPIDLDVGDVDFDDQVQGGDLLLSVANPFGVAVSGELRVEYPGGSVAKALPIPSAPTSTVVVPFTADELRAFLGSAPVALTAGGTVAAQGGVITIRPEQRLEIDARMRLTLRIGG